MEHITDTGELITINTNTGILKKGEILPFKVLPETHASLDNVCNEMNGDLPNDDITTFVKRMKMTRKLYGGIGLSANQVGYNLRLFVIGTDEIDVVCINPKIVKVSEDLIRDKEGCLSFPGLFFTVPRPAWVEAEYMDENGVTHHNTFYNLTARCFLHELDHLNGIKFIDGIKPLALKMARQKQQKIFKKVLRSQKG